MGNRILETRQMWVNGAKAQRVKEKESLQQL